MRELTDIDLHNFEIMYRNSYNTMDMIAEIRECWAMNADSEQIISDQLDEITELKKKLEDATANKENNDTLVAELHAAYQEKSYKDFNEAVENFIYGYTK